MTTFCPSCGMNVEADLDVSLGRRRWKCASCSFILKEEGAGLSAPASGGRAPAVAPKPVARAPIAKAAGPVRSAGAPARPVPQGKPAPARDLDSKGKPERDVTPLPGLTIDTSDLPPPSRVNGPSPSTPEPEPVQAGWDGSFDGLEGIEFAAGDQLLALNLRRDTQLDEPPKALPSPSPAPEAPSAEDLGDPLAGLMLDDDAPPSSAASAGMPLWTRANPAPVSSDTGKGRAAPSDEVLAAAPAPSAAPSTAGFRAQQGGTDGALFDTVLVCDGSSPLREAVREGLAIRRAGRNIVACENGEQLIEILAEKMASGSFVDAVILDAELEILDGFHAAIALRAIERAFRIATPTPLLFLTSLPCDDGFRRVLEYCKPARYLNKGADAGAPSFISGRLLQVLSALRSGI
jgi:CheY-like chemotaxis protein